MIINIVYLLNFLESNMILPFINKTFKLFYKFMYNLPSIVFNSFQTRKNIYNLRKFQQLPNTKKSTVVTGFETIPIADL